MANGQFKGPLRNRNWFGGPQHSQTNWFGGPLHASKKQQPGLIKDPTAVIDVDVPTNQTSQQTPGAPLRSLADQTTIVGLDTLENKAIQPPVMGQTGSPGNHVPITHLDTLENRAVQQSPTIGPARFPGNHVPITHLDTLENRAIQPPVTGPTRLTNGYQQNQGQYIPLPGIPSFPSFAVEQETKILPSTPDTPFAFPEKSGGTPLRRAFRSVVKRLQEPQPEGPLTRGVQVVRLDLGLGLAPIIAVTNAVGILIVSIAYYISVLGSGYPLEEIMFFTGMVIVIVPNFIRLLSRTPTRLERILLVGILACFSYFLQYMVSPLHFSGFDEFLHWRTADDILITGHLFSFNSMLPVSSFYPGLEIVTNAITTTTGLDTFYAGNIVIFASRLMMVLTLYLFYEHLTNSSRMASIAVVIYMANPHFFFFDGLYNYETIALPMAMLVIYILARYDNTSKNYRWVKVAAWIILAAITVTHHMTDYFFCGFLLLWAVISFFRPVSRNARAHLTAIAIFGTLAAIAYAFLFPGNPVKDYLSQYFGPVFAQFQQILLGLGAARPLFTNSLQVAPIWDRLFITGTVVLVTGSLPFGLISLQRLYKKNALAVTLGIISFGYPLTQAFRFTSFGTEVTDRSAAFLYLPIAYLLTILIAHLWPTRRLNPKSISLATSIILFMLIGGIVVGAGPNLVTAPGPYLVVADNRSVEPEGINAAIWSQSYLGPNNVVATDRINQMLMSTYGHQRVVTHLGDNVDVSPIFYSTQFDATDSGTILAAQIHYLIVDTRLSTSLPVENVYFENDPGPTNVISRNALLKFNTIPQIDRLFDSGDIVIYDTGTLLNGSGP